MQVQVQVQVQVSASANANSAFYKYSTVPVSRPPPLSFLLSFSPCSPLQPPRPRARHSRTALISALRPSARPPLRLAIPRPHPVCILSAFAFPNRSSRLNRQLLVVSDHHCPAGCRPWAAGQAKCALLVRDVTRNPEPFSNGFPCHKERV